MLLAVPLFSATRETVGFNTLARCDIQPFSTEVVALVETFADQATVSIKNLRLFRELQTMRKRDVAIAEVLGVINRSRDQEHSVTQSIDDPRHATVYAVTSVEPVHVLNAADGELYREVM